MRKHVKWVLLLGCMGGAKAAGAEPTKPPTNPRASSSTTRAKASSDAKGDLAASGGRDEAQVMLDVLGKIGAKEGRGEVGGETLTAMALRAVEKRVAGRFAQLDKNHDGRIARAEVPRMNAVRFSRFDRDHDGAFTSQELASVMREHCAERVKQLMARYDANHDGRVSRAEVASEPARDERLARLGTSPAVAEEAPLVTDAKR